MSKLKEEGDENLTMGEVYIKPYQHFEQVITKYIHHFYISNSIEKPEHYIEMIHQIRVAGPDDVIFIHLNTPGGDLTTGVQIINAMAASQAHIVCSVEAQSYSLGTMIFLSADEFIVQDNCMMMFHQYIGGVYGKGHEQKAQLLATEEWFEDLTRNIYVPFLSEDEFNGIIKGGDIWIQTEDIKNRLNVMVAAMQEEIEVELEAEKEELTKVDEKIKVPDQKTKKN